MTEFNHRIPDDMAAQVMAEATRLYAEANKGYSLSDLEQACLEASIPQEIITKAIRNVERKREQQQVQRQIMQNRIKEQVQKGMFASIALVIPTIILSSVFSGVVLFPSPEKQIETVSQSQQQSNSPFKILKVKPRKLEYLTDPKGLSIALRKVNYGDSINAMIGTDNYEPLMIESGKIGDSYEYKGIHDYRIKIIGFGENEDETVTFQIEQLEPEKYTALKRLEEKVKQLQEEYLELQAEKQNLESDRDNNQRQLKWKDETIERLQEQIKQLKKKSEQLQTKTKQLQAQAKRLESQRDSNLQQQANSTNSTVKRLEEKVKQLQQQSGELKAQIQRETAQHKTQIQKVERERDNNRLKLERKNRTVKELEYKINVLQNTLDTFKLR